MEIKKNVLADTSASWDENPLPPYPDGQPHVTVLDIEIPAGACLAMHYHPMVNAGVVTQGTLTVVSADGHRRHFHKGEAIVELVDKPHYGVNEGDQPVRLIMFYAGAEHQPLSLPAD